jgi:DNA (cytosine-5)-methyltransferase 1
MTWQAIDLFSGGGGLTVGLKAAGFSVRSAVENNAHAVATYRANHPEVKIISKDIRNVSVKDLQLDNDSKLSLIAGCPPCQGFTSLTSKYKRDDPRNSLITEMERLIYECQPDAVMMENVPGLVNKGSEKFEGFVTRLRIGMYFKSLITELHKLESALFCLLVRAFASAYQSQPIRRMAPGEQRAGGVSRTS